MPDRKRIAVIGAGPAGLAALARLTSEGYAVTAFERRDRVGGLWNSGYDALHLITARSVSMFDGFPQPEGYPLYASKDLVVDYMQAFAEERGLLPLIRFGVEVEEVRPAGPSGLGGWVVHTSGDPWPEVFDAVVVANGHLHHKYVPQLPGEFSGKLIHSSEFRNADDVDGERVLVVGAGNSGCDLAVDVAAARKRVTVSVRSPFTFVPKLLFGKARSDLPIAKLHPVVAERISRALIRVAVGRPEQYPGLRRPTSRNLRKQRAIVNDLLPYWIMHGRIEVKPALAGVSGRTVSFSDGTSGEFDTILLATGFRYHAPFLSDEVVRRENDMPRRWGAGTLVDGVANLYFVGLVAPLGAQWPVYDIQSGLIVEMMRLQDAHDYPIVRDLQEGEAGFGELEVLRDKWFKEVARVRKRLQRLQSTVLMGR